MASTINCDASLSNISVSKCRKLPQLIKGMITAPKSFTLSFADAADPTQWQTAIKADKATRVYLWPDAVQFENTSEEAIYEETPLRTIPVRDGRYRFKLSFQENLEVAKEMATHTSDEAAFFIDNEGQLLGYEVTTGNIAGLEIGMINPENLYLNDGSTASKKPVYIELQKPEQINRYGILIDANLNSVVGLSNVEVTIVGTPSATEIVAKVVKYVDNVQILGLDGATPPGDFILLDSGGSAQTISTITDNGDSTYTFAGVAFVSGTLNIKAAKDLSLDAYESLGAATVTIS